MADEKQQPSAVLTGRSFLALTGIDAVIGFDENTVTLDSGGSVLAVSGEDLSMVKLSLESGQVSITGRIDALVYTDEQPKKSLLSRWFR